MEWNQNQKRKYVFQYLIRKNGDEQIIHQRLYFLRNNYLLIRVALKDSFSNNKKNRKQKYLLYEKKMRKIVMEVTAHSACKHKLRNVNIKLQNDFNILTMITMKTRIKSLQKNNHENAH